MAPKKAPPSKAMASKASSKSSTPRSTQKKESSSQKIETPTESYLPRYPQCLREAPQLPLYFVSVVNHPSRFILGPIYSPNSPDSLSTYYPVNFDEPLLFSLPGLHRTGWNTRGTIISWPTVFPSWTKWVDRMKRYLHLSWHTMGIYEAIDLSTQAFEFNPNLIAAAAYYDPFWVDYEVQHEKVVKLHNKVLDLNHSNWELPPNSSKTLFKKHQNWLWKKNHKRDHFLAQAEKSVMAMRPLVDKKIKMDAEAMARDKEHAFLTYAWEKFHVFVTWSFSHYFEIIRIDADGNPVVPVNA